MIAAKELASDYTSVQSELLWYRTYLTANKLEQGADETADAYSERLLKYFEALKKEDDVRCLDECERFYSAFALYDLLYSIGYEGDWGDTLGDFFLPCEDAVPSVADAATFLPFALAMSEGQRAGLHYLTLMSLLTTAVGDEAAVNSAYNDIQSSLAEIDAVSVYDGINRAIFRDCVALTSKAQMEAKMGINPYAQATTESTLKLIGYSILSVISFVGSIVSLSMAVSHIGGIRIALANLNEARHAVILKRMTTEELSAIEKSVSKMKLRFGFGNFFFVVSLAMIVFSIICSSRLSAPRL